MEGVRFIPCKICSAPSTGFHFGALTCEACKAFFRRVLKSGATLQTLTCSGTDPPPIDPLGPLPQQIEDGSDPANNGDDPNNPDNNNNNNNNNNLSSHPQQPGQSRRCDLAFSPKKCPKCRYQRCLEVGMGPAASKIGRPTKGRVAEVREELHRIKPWLEFKQNSSSNKFKEDGISNSNGDLASTEPRSASLLMLASKESRKRAALYGETNSKKRHPSMPASVYYGGAGASQSTTTAGLQAAAFASHVRHFSGDVIDSKYRPYLGMNEMDFDDADEDDDDGEDGEDEDFFAQQRHKQSQQPPQNEPMNLLRTNPNNSDFSPSPSIKPEPSSSPNVASPSGLPPGLTSQAPATAILTVIQQYNNSGGNRQRFVQSLRDLGADREGSNLAWLYQSADQWFDIANVMFQSPLAISNLLSSATSATAMPQFSAAMAPPAPPAPSAVGSEQLKILSQFAIAMPTAQQPQQRSPVQPPPPPAPTSIPLPVSLPPLTSVPTSLSTNQPTSSPLLASSAFSPWTQALRSETMARQVVQATKHLASLNLSRQGMRPGALNLSAPDLWGFLMQNFEANTTHIINFARSIPGYSMITSVSDRALLSMNSFFPLLFANMSIEFDPVSENIRLYWMSGQEVDDGLSCARSILKTPQEAAVENGSAMKTTNLTVVEFGFMCALVHFNPGIRGLQDPISVEMVASELMNSVEYFINSNFPAPNSASSAAVRVAFPAAFLPPTTNGSSPSLATSRIAELNRLVTYFRNLNASSNWISAEMGTGIHQQAIQTATAAAISAATNPVSNVNNNINNSNHSRITDHQQGDDAAVREMYRKMFDLIASSSPSGQNQGEGHQAVSFSSTTTSTVNTPPSFFQQFLPPLTIGNNNNNTNNNETERIFCQPGVSSSQTGHFQRH